ncbi:MAG: exodeoxyribonuclease VII large subunit, partial [Candidatus Electrothrix sp. AR3]|nr:exodeoxyribonuclease VII large subunit [Candidatus Electrothrix sp. AR3]
MNIPENNQKFFTVSALTTDLRTLLEGYFPFISVVGEISDLRQPSSGHLYFTLKDDQAQIKAVLFRMQRRYLEKQPQNGELVLCQGRLSVYEARGDYQLILDSLDFHGAGQQQLAFEQLKRQLAAEGLFAEAIKKPLPAQPNHITLVTSPNGAAVHDFIRIAQNRYPQVRLSVYPASMQGAAAAAEIRKAIAAINRHKKQLATEIIVLCRGGGSVEDLQAFNDEELTRQIRRSEIPVVNAVGHAIDFTLADFAADLRAPTPSAAAEMLLPDQDVLADQVEELAHRLRRAMQYMLERQQDQLTLYRQRLSSSSQPVTTLHLHLDHLADNLEHAIHDILTNRQTRLNGLDNRLRQSSPFPALILHQQRLEELQHRLSQAGRSMMKEKGQQLAKAAEVLDAVSPLSTLARGYA